MGTVHNYAGSKAALVVDLLVDDLQATIRERTATLPPPPLIDQLLHLYVGFLEQYAAHPALARTYIKESVFAPTGAFDRYMQLTANFVAQIAELCARSGELRPEVDPLLAAQILFDSYLSVVVLFLRTEECDVGLATAALRGRLTAILDVPAVSLCSGPVRHDPHRHAPLRGEGHSAADQVILTLGGQDRRPQQRAEHDLHLVGGQGRPPHSVGCHRRTAGTPTVGRSDR